MPTTSRLALPYPASTDPPAGHTQIQNLATAIDGAAIDLAEGTLAARPAPAIRGRWYYATDVAILYRDSGSTWRSIQAMLGTDTIVAGNIAADAIGTSELAPLAVTNAEVAAAAAIARSKLDFGSGLVDADLAASSLLYAAYRTILTGSGYAPQSSAAGTYPLSFGNAMEPGSAQVPIALQIASADFPALGSKVPKLRLRAQYFPNTVAPGQTMTVGLYPIAGSTGTGGNLIMTLGSVVAGSTVVFASGTSPSEGNSGDFTLPADGDYLVGAVWAGALAANSHTALTVELQQHWV